MPDIQHKTFLFDATRCIDCRACMVACSVENKIPMNKTRIWVAGVGLMGKFPDLERASMVYHCMHCNEPDCLSACPVGAYTKRPDGPVIYDSKKCIGCRYCMNACPFGVPHFDYDKGLIDGAFIDKCSMCTQRIDVGLEPACVATCPTGALMFGERDALMKYAHDRLTANRRAMLTMFMERTRTAVPRISSSRMSHSRNLAFRSCPPLLSRMLVKR